MVAAVAAAAVTTANPLTCSLFPSQGPRLMQTHLFFFFLPSPALLFLAFSNPRFFSGISGLRGTTSGLQWTKVVQFAYLITYMCFLFLCFKECILIMCAMSRLPLLQVQSVRTLNATEISFAVCALMMFDEMLIKLAN